MNSSLPSVPRLFPNATIVCIGGGPSLTGEDVNACKGRVPVVVINNGYQLAPWADVLYAADRKWIDWHNGVPGFTGPKYSITSADPTTRPDWTVLENTGVLGLEPAPTGLRTGYNGGYQAINLAMHIGASRILLLGYDLGIGVDGRTHWHGDHPDRQPAPFYAMLDAFPTLVEPLRAAGVTVVNCSRRTALACFPCAALEDELGRLAVAA